MPELTRHRMRTRFAMRALALGITVGSVGAAALLAGAASPITGATSPLAPAAGVVAAATASMDPGGAFPSAWFFPDRADALKGMEGQPAPELKTKSWIGKAVDLKSSKGKVVVVDFWATWCGPCMASIPHNVDLVKKYQGKDLVFVGVHDANSGWDKAQSVVNDKNINYPVALDDAGGPTAKAFNLGFWPTYVLIDRAGVIRGIGLTPDHVEDAVKLLLAEAPPAGLGGEAANPSGLPPEWYFGGANRTPSTVAMEGKPAPAIVAARWEGDAMGADEMKDRVVVLHFCATGNSLSVVQAESLAAIEREMGPQGVAVVSVFAADDSWEDVSGLIKQGHLPKKICLDAAATAGASGPGSQAPGTQPLGTQTPGTQTPGSQTPATPASSAGSKRAPPSGATAAKYGVPFMPCTVIIDRAGVVRAAGVRVDKTKDVLNKLLAERKADGAAGAGAGAANAAGAGGTAAGEAP